MLGPEVVLFAAGVDSTKTACAAAGRDEEPRISIAKKRCPSGAVRPRSSIDWKFLCNKLLSGTARRSLITDISNPQIFGAPADLQDNFLEIPHTKVCLTQLLVQCACQSRIACQPPQLIENRGAFLYEGLRGCGRASTLLSTSVGILAVSRFEIYDVIKLR